MNPYAAYQLERPFATSRIDLLLALYDGAIDRLENAIQLLQAGDVHGARTRLTWCQLMIAELAAGVRLDVVPDIGENVLRLYEFVSYQLSQCEIAGLTGALKVLEHLREGFEAIRAESIEMERTGKIPGIDSLHAVSKIA